MKLGFFQQILLYRYRYVVGYAIFVLFVMTMITWQIGNLGPGLAEAEKASALASANWTWQSWQDAGLSVVNLPYILLQKTSIQIFGLSPFSLRLPSVVIGLATSVTFFALMRLMHRSHIALATSILFTSASTFVAMTHFGNPTIMTVFAWVLVSYCFVRLLRTDGPPLTWAALMGASAAFALYTPFGAYALLAAALILAIHPKIRRSLRALTGQQFVLSMFMFVPLVVPLLLGLFKSPEQVWTLLGLTANLPSIFEAMQNTFSACVAIVVHAPLLPELRLGNLPLLNVGLGAILIAGIVRAVIDWQSVRTQFILISLMLVLIAAGLNPEEKTYAALLIPLFMLVASGVSMLFHQWYRLFPRNPYARSFGLLPIVIFLGFIVVYQYQQYFVAWANAPRTYQVFDSDSQLVAQQLKKYPSAVVTVPDTARGLYEVLLRKYPAATFGPTANVQQVQIVSASAGKPTVADTHALQPLTNDDSKDPLRFWVVAPK